MKDELSPDVVAESLGRNAGGFGRAQQSYYGHPVLRKAHWRWEIENYFWVGGIMSGSAALAAIAEHFGDPQDAALVRTGRYLALGGAAVSGALLTKDLGRPERFLNMLRIVKFGSPMSIGVWSLVWFSASAGLALGDQLKRDGILPFDAFGFIPKIVRDGMLAGVSGIMASYTGVLISATAVPVWYEGRRHIPAIFVSSAVATACAANAALLALSGGARSTLRKLERLETLAGVAELVLLLDYERSVGADAAALFAGKNGRRLKTWTMLAGTAVPLLLNVASWLERPTREDAQPRPLPLKTLLASALTLYGGLVLRQSLLEAGRRSADDPKPVLRPK